MELSKKLKNRPSYPFETIAVAVAFSPRMASVVAEAKRLTQKFGSKLILIHAGPINPESQNLMDGLIRDLKINEVNYSIEWEDENPVDFLLSTCKKNIVDLLIIGALQKENIFNFYLGSIARKVCRKAKCSVLVLVQPKWKNGSIKKIVVSGAENPKTQFSLEVAAYIGNSEKAEEVIVARETYLPSLEYTIADNCSDEEAEEIRKKFIDDGNEFMNSLFNSVDDSGMTLKGKTLNGKPGFSISQFAKSIEADLLVVNSPDHSLTLLDRVFTHDMEYILEDIPCNLLIVHSRVQPTENLS